MAAPFYPPYANILTALGMQPVLLPCDASTRYQPTIAMLEALDPLPDGLIVASPCNPAGTMLPPAELQAIARWCHANGVRLVSDEIYHGLTWGTVAESTAIAHGSRPLSLDHSSARNAAGITASRPSVRGSPRTFAPSAPRSVERFQKT
jgi:aspartate/methionine/tyrosine aminotransferase